MNDHDRLAQARYVRIYLKYRGPRDLIERLDLIGPPTVVADNPSESTTPTGTKPPDDAKWANRPLYGALPRPYGHAESVIGLSTIAAPLLAGFSITAAALVLQVYERLRYPNLTITLLSAAALVMIMTIQFGFWARRWWWGTLAQALDAWPDAEREARVLSVERELVQHYGAYARWERRARVS